MTNIPEHPTLVVLRPENSVPFPEVATYKPIFVETPPALSGRVWYKTLLLMAPLPGEILLSIRIAMNIMVKV